MNYRHSFHAGNFADAFKHIILIALIKSLQRKDTPFCYLDTHAGIGLYDLLTESTQKSKEYENGISKILTAENCPPLITEYISCIQQFNPNQLQFYPGSPEIVKYFLRPQDRMVLCELHPEDYQTLKKRYPHHKQIAIHHQDGYLGLKAFLPPKEKRGLILIDPPYEQTNEFSQLFSSLLSALKRFENGVYAIWYPIKNREAIARFYRELKEKISRPLLISELTIYPDDISSRLNGCGMIIVNPPFQLDIQLNEIIPWLRKTLDSPTPAKT
jgi:23S rRNA (adenine2030-N6)-methyltransferase